MHLSTLKKSHPAVMEYLRLERAGQKVSLIRRVDGYCYDFSSAWCLCEMKAQTLGFGWLEMIEGDPRNVLDWLRSDDAGPVAFCSAGPVGGDPGRWVVSLGKSCFGDLAVCGGDSVPVPGLSCIVPDVGRGAQVVGGGSE